MIRTFLCLVTGTKFLMLLKLKAYCYKDVFKNFVYKIAIMVIILYFISLATK